jgi:CopG family nickel-responsive transcriptional regulator
MSRVVRFGVSIPPKLLKKFDSLIKERKYTNRSEAIRDLIREFAVGEEWRKGKEVVGSLTLVYNHDVRGIAEKLTHLQHSFHGNIISSMHIHLDEQNCMEILVLRGDAEKIKKVADSLISSKGVKHGKLTMTTTGKEL